MRRWGYSQKAYGAAKMWSRSRSRNKTRTISVVSGVPLHERGDDTSTHTRLRLIRLVNSRRLTRAQVLITCSTDWCSSVSASPKRSHCRLILLFSRVPPRWSAHDHNAAGSDLNLFRMLTTNHNHCVHTPSSSPYVRITNKVLSLRDDALHIYNNTDTNTCFNTKYSSVSPSKSHNFLATLAPVSLSLSDWICSQFLRLPS